MGDGSLDACLTIKRKVTGLIRLSLHIPLTVLMAFKTTLFVLLCKKGASVLPFVRLQQRSISAISRNVKFFMGSTHRRRNMC